MGGRAGRAGVCHRPDPAKDRRREVELVLDVLEVELVELVLDVEEVLGKCHLFVHG